jgi:hypothetical protein
VLFRSREPGVDPFEEGGLTRLGLGNAGEGTLSGGVIDLPSGRPLGEAMNTAGMEGGSLLHESQCAEGV